MPIVISNTALEDRSALEDEKNSENHKMYILTKYVQIIKDTN